MQKKPLFFFLLIFLSLITYSQDFDHYIPIKSSGKVPEDLRKTSYQKYIEDVKKLDYGGSSSEFAAKKKFLLQSRFYNDIILHSGRVLFNDPMTLYINKIADVLLKDHDSLRKQVRFYTLKSTVANAYCMDNGVILVTTGLLAQLENESQLAYIIGHELTHYVKKHAINQFLESDKMEKGKDAYSDFSFNEKIIASLYYSKEDEFEADKESVNLYLANSSYSIKALESVFDVLQYSYLPFDDIEFDTTFFNTKYWKMPSEYWTMDVRKLTVKEEDESDLNSTHPNIKRRRMMMDDYAEKISEVGRKTYVVSESEFNAVQKIARYELSRLYLLDLNYANAIYNSYLLLKENPNSTFLKSTIAYALYGISKYKNNKNVSTVVRSPGKIEGKSQVLFQMLRKIKGEELNGLAVNYIWQLYRLNPNDPLLKEISKDVVNELVFKYKVSLDDFSMVAPTDGAVVADTAVVEKGNKKYEKIKKGKKKKKENTAFMLVEVLDNPELKLAFNDSYDDIKSKKYNDFDEEIVSPEELKAKKKKEKELAKNGYSLGIDSIIALDPFFIEWNMITKENERLIGAENKKIKLTAQMKENASKAKLSMQLFDSKIIGEDDVALINDIGTLHDWVNETMEREDITMINCNYGDLKEICDRYHTHYLYFNGLRTIKYRDSDYWWYVMSTLFTLPIFTPYYFYKAIAPAYITQYYGILFDVTANKTLKARATTTSLKYKNDIVNSILYDEFNQIKRRDKSQIKK